MNRRIRGRINSGEVGALYDNGRICGQAYAQLYPDRLAGFISIDSAPFQRNYVTAVEICLLKRMEPVYTHYPWELL